MKRLIYLVIVAILLILIRNTALSIIRLKGDEAKLANLKKQLEEEKKTNEFYKERLIYVKKNEFVESEARDKLNLTKEGEFIVVGTDINKPRFGSGEFDYNTSSWKKWYQMFF